MRFGRSVAVAGAVIGMAVCGGGGSRGPSAPAPVNAVCGNSRVELGEECDDGNANNADGCFSTCQRPVTWVKSDPHIHSSGCGVSGVPEDVERVLRNQQIQVGATLVWGDTFDDDAGYFTGRDHPVVGGPGLIQHYDLEVSHFPADEGGHLLLLGLDSLNFSDAIFSRPGSGVPVTAWARRQPRAVVGMAHGQFWSSTERWPRPPVVCCVPWEYAAHVARGQLDFLSMERLPADLVGPVDESTFQLWRAAQNSGFRVAIAGASDWPCITHSFNDRTPRTDVIVEGPLTYESWLQGLKAGRTAAAIGYSEQLNVRVDGERIGSEVHLPRAGEVTVTLESIQPVPEDAEVLVNGEVAARVRLEGGIQLAEVKLPVSKSSWISARNAHVLTSPVYVLVGGRPIRASPGDTCYLLRMLDYVGDLAASRQLDLRDSEAEALAAYGEARTELQKRFQEAGGFSCP